MIRCAHFNGVLDRIIYQYYGTYVCTLLSFGTLGLACIYDAVEDLRKILLNPLRCLLLTIRPPCCDDYQSVKFSCEV